MLNKLFFRNKFFIPLLTLPIILSFIGLIFIFEASSVTSFKEFGDSLHYLKLQLLWLGIGLAAMIFFAILDYHKLYYLAFLFITSSIILLMGVLIPGIGSQAGGARRWLDFGFLNIQPSELAKFSVIIYLASWFTYKERKRFFAFLILLGFLTFLVILQPDMGTAIIIFLLSVIIYFLSGGSLLHFLLLLPVSVLIFYLLIKISPYRFNRLIAFLNPNIDPLGITYHINQIMISLSNGGLIGTGLSVSRQKYLYLPEAHTDSIFAIIAEEFGFIGAVTIIILYFILIYKIYYLVGNAPDRLAKLLSGGIFAFFNLQIIINLAGIVGLFPLTGVPLPFISYGGSNLLVSFALMGVLMNIEKRIKTIKQ